MLNGTGLAATPLGLNDQWEDSMSIQWNSDLNEQLQRASESGKAVLLDFSAAPI